MNELKEIPKTVYGPVNSWRLGRSLGIDVLAVDSICSFECVYCQLGKINRVQTSREVFVPTSRILSDFKESEWQTAEAITFSGSGEPTLALNLGEVIRGIKAIADQPIVVLTNSSLLLNAEVRKELLAADRIFCKLDAWTEEAFQKIDRPAVGIELESIVKGIEMLNNEFEGRLAVQTMILKRPTDSDLDSYVEILNRITPAEVQLYLPSRPIPDQYVVSSRGNVAAISGDHRRLNTISKSEFSSVAKKIQRLSGIDVVTSQQNI